MYANSIEIRLNNFFIMSEQKTLTLHQTISYVREFHESFRLPVRHTPTGLLNEQEMMLRYNLMKEENEEYLEAAKNGDIVEIADALGDMLYILCGTINAHGLQLKISDVFEEIQRSNMSKLDENGQPIYREDGKVMKSSRYFRPDIKSILKDGLDQ
jgi:predicted HAD superfamily Cof-like phosphohydrolase